MLVRVEPDHLVAPVLRGLRLGEQSARVVAAGLGGPRTPRGGAAEVLREPDRHRLDPAREVRTRRRRDEEKGDLLRGVDGKRDLAREHHRPEIQAVLGR